MYLVTPNTLDVCKGKSAIALVGGSKGADWVYSELLMFKASGNSVYFNAKPNGAYGCEFDKIQSAD